jgi:hypothetical protein
MESIVSTAKKLGAQVQEHSRSARGERRLGPGTYDPHLIGTTIENWDTIKLVLTSSGAAAFAKFSKDLILQWMKNRDGRSVTIRKGEVEVTLKGDVRQADLRRALDAIGEKPPTKQ